MIRNALPECCDDISLSDWLLQAQEIITIEKQCFRQEHEDEAGWGATWSSKDFFAIMVKHLKNP